MRQPCRGGDAEDFSPPGRPMLKHIREMEAERETSSARNAEERLDAINGPVTSPQLARLRDAALESTPVHQDNALRQRTELETEALLAYLNGELELPHAPVFLKATMSVLQRAMIEQFHETHVEAALTADVAPGAKLRKNMTHIAIFAKLYEANADSPRGRAMIDRMMDDVKMLYFDGIHTLHFVFHSKRLAAHYCGDALRLHGTFIELEDSTSNLDGGILRPAQLRRQYAVRIYGSDSIGLVALLATLGTMQGVKIVDAERPRLDSTEVVDNRYVLLHFWGAEYPNALRGVTKLRIAGSLMTIHHHLLHPRLPCARCYAPYHTTGFCKATQPQLLRSNTKFQRTYAGMVPPFRVGTAVQYQHSDGDSLGQFLTALQTELTRDIAIATNKEEGTEVEESTDLPAPQGDAAMETNARSSILAEGSERSADSLPLTGDAINTEDEAGYRVAHSAASRQKVKKGGAQPHRLAEQAQTQPGRRDQAPNKGKAHHNAARPIQQGDQDHNAKVVPARRKPRTKGVSFVAFNRDRAKGRFDALGDESDSSADDSSVGEDAEADYAYLPRVHSLTDSAGAELTSVDSAKTHGDGGDMEVDEEHRVSQDRNSIADSYSDEYVVSSAPSQTQSPAATPGSECRFSIDSALEECKTEEATYDEVVTRMDADWDPSHTHEALPEGTDASPTLSQDGFVYEETKAASGMPQQLPTFILPFQGKLIHVPANGQCVYSALHASTTYIEGDTLSFSSTEVRDINRTKRSLYTLMMMNLSKDVEANVVDPQRELQRLYPKQAAPTDAHVATAALYAHYAQERVHSVNMQVPVAYWAGC